MTLESTLNEKIDLFIMSNVGPCATYFSIGNEKTRLYNDLDDELGERPRIDDIANLISGFMNAQLAFYDSIELGTPEEYSDRVRIKNDVYQRYLFKGKGLSIVAFLENPGFMEERAYLRFSELLRSILTEIEINYEQEIEDFSNKGCNDFSGLDSFVSDKIKEYKLQMYMGYLQEILARAISFNVKREDSIDLMTGFNPYYNNYDFDTALVLCDEVKNQIMSWRNEHPTFERIIDLTNKESNYAWKLFDVPIIK